MEFGRNSPCTWHSLGIPTLQDQDSPPAPKSPRDGPRSWQGSYTHQGTKHFLPVTPHTLHPPASPEEPRCQPWTLECLPASCPQGTTHPNSLLLPGCGFEAALKLCEPRSPVGHSAASPCMEQLNTVPGPRWLDFCLQRNFKLIEIGVDSTFPLLRDAWVTGRKRSWTPT